MIPTNVAVEIIKEARRRLGHVESLKRFSSSSAQLVFLSIVVAALSVGCDRFFLPKPPETHDGSYLVHVVSGGEAREDIGTILLWYTGSEDTLAAVQMANPGMDLSVLRPGQRVMIPSSVVTQTNAMPRRKFTLGVDVPPPLVTPTGVVEPRAGGKSDPLEELMRKHEGRSPQRETPQRVVGAPPSEPNFADAPTTPLVERPTKSVAPGAPKATNGSRKLEAFSEDEIGVLPVPGSQRLPGVDSAERIESDKPTTVETKNPRPGRAPQPEVFDEE